MNKQKQGNIFLLFKDVKTLLIERLNEHRKQTLIMRSMFLQHANKKVKEFYSSINSLKQLSSSRFFSLNKLEEIS